MGVLAFVTSFALASAPPGCPTPNLPESACGCVGGLSWMKTPDQLGFQVTTSISCSQPTSIDTVIYRWYTLPPSTDDHLRVIAECTTGLCTGVDYPWTERLNFYESIVELTNASCPAGAWFDLTVVP
jgi:hypothetical protein